MKINFIILLSLLIIYSYSTGTDGTWCHVNDEFNNTKIFTTISEV